jgi:ABC-type multidrug transport system fused ATPase/permease subunit
MAAGTRIAPAILRIQQGALVIRSSRGSAEPTLELISRLPATEIVKISDLDPGMTYEGFDPTIEVSNVSLIYPGKNYPAVKNAILNIPSGTTVAVVGASGAGKTTLIDLILGVLTPTNGKVLVSGLSPMEAISKWPGAISYVPQDVQIVNGTVRQNIALGYPELFASNELINYAVKFSNLEKFVQQLPSGLDSFVGDRGAQISGGQRQRLGIARALFSKPKCLVLDEATSSLDGETEENITNEISQLHGTVTVIIIAHRLSTIRNADLVVYMDSGVIKATGTFDEVRSKVPDFDHQAKLMGL